jgi:hypothetical protein
LGPGKGHLPARLFVKMNPKKTTLVFIRQTVPLKFLSSTIGVAQVEVYFELPDHKKMRE